jgi:hypothetical protein
MRGRGGAWKATPLIHGLAHVVISAYYTSSFNRLLEVGTIYRTPPDSDGAPHSPLLDTQMEARQPQ